MKKLLVPALLAATVMSGANAATLFQSIPDLTVEPLTNAWCSSCSGGYRVFDSFTLATAASIQSVTFAVQSDYAFPTTVDVSFWTDNAGTVGTQLSSALYAPGDFTSTLATQFNTTLVTVNYNQSLNAGTYWISFYNPVDLAIPGYAGGSNLLFQQGGGPRDQSAAFALSGGAVPDAPTWALLIGGFGLVGIAARRQRVVAA